MLLVAVPAVALALLSVLAFFGSWVWWLDVVANFRPQLAVLLLVGGTALLVGRWKKTGVAVLAAALLDLAVVVPLFIGPGGPPAGTHVRVLSFNVFASNTRYDEVIGYIKGVGADVVVLHEASRPWEQAIAGADLGYEEVETRAKDLIFGTLVLAAPGTRVVSYGFALDQPRAVEVDVPLDGGGTLRLLSVHAVAPTTAERAGLRDAELAFAGDWAASQEQPYVVVGDLNASPWSSSFRRLLRQGSLRDSERGFGIQASFPATKNPVFRVPIDHLLVSADVGVLDRRLGPPLGSDHFPLVVDLSVATAANG